MYLRTEVLYLLRGVADHLDPVLVGGHAAGEVGDLHQLVSVLSKHASRLVNLTIVLLRYFSSEQIFSPHLTLIPSQRGLHQQHQRGATAQETVAHVVNLAHKYFCYARKYFCHILNV